MIKKKNAIKKGTPKKERHFGVILEDINSKFQVLVEGHDILVGKYNKLDSKVDKLDSKVDKLDSKVDKLDSKVENLKGEFYNFRMETKDNFKTVFEYLSRIDDELKYIKQEISELKNRLVKKADLERVLDLENRVKRIEAILEKSK